MKRIISVLLVLLMLFSFVACNKEEENVEESNTSTTTDVIESDDQTQVLDVQRMDFGGKELAVLQRKNTNTELYTEELTGELVPDAVYKRNAFVEDYLKVKLIWKDAEGGYAEQKQALSNALSTGEEVYHITANYAYYAAPWAAENMFLDMNAIEDAQNHLDFTKAWWNQSYSKEATINGKLYFMVGDACTSAMERVECLTINEALVNDILNESTEEFLNHVYDRTWTYEYFLQCIAQMGNGADTGMWGASLQMNSTSIDGFLGALAINTVERDDRGGATPDYDDERAINIGEALRTLYHSNPSVNAKEGWENGINPFVDGTAMFYGGILKDISSTLKDLAWDYAVMPYPLWDENQTEYRSIPHDEYSILGIPSNVYESTEATTAALEVMNYQSLQEVRPALYEKSFKQRYMKTSFKAQMFDYVINNTYYDFGFIYTSAMGTTQTDGNAGFHCYRNYIRPATAPGGLGSIVETSMSVATTQLAAFIEKFN
ncbi:MAG: hypothetical protein IJY47_02395 [Clostridia bacterium]|nr:hypothetical protein [Clostridia bacterium]